MARLRDRVSETAETRGELVLYRLGPADRDHLRALRGTLRDPVDRGAGRGLDQAVVQGMLPGDASLTEACRIVIAADSPWLCRAGGPVLRTARTRAVPGTSGRRPPSPTSSGLPGRQAASPRCCPSPRCLGRQDGRERSCPKR